jgi:NifU-like protein involved in Fe-S cluster formation
MASAATLYTPEVLALATGLAAFPWREDLPLRGEARSQTCGSSIALSLSQHADGAIDVVAVKAHACAIGQAAAAIFARSASGNQRQAIEQAERALALWLAGMGPRPDWPGIAAIAAAVSYPARHGAIMLAWRAALAALPSS